MRTGFDHKLPLFIYFYFLYLFAFEILLYIVIPYYNNNSKYMIMNLITVIKSMVFINDIDVHMHQKTTRPSDTARTMSESLMAFPRELVKTRNTEYGIRNKESADYRDKTGYSFFLSR